MNRKPRLRPVQAVPYDSGGERLVCLRDPSGISRKSVVLPMRAFFVVALMDGAHTLAEIQEEYLLRFGEGLHAENLEEMVRQLDEALMLEGPRVEEARAALLAEFSRAPTRKAALAGQAYPVSPQRLQETLRRCFTGARGPGEIAPGEARATIAAIAAPHIDLKRGGPVYAHAWKALAEGCEAETFVILGTSHEPTRQLYVATEKDFETPLGAVPCDREFTRELIQRAGLARGADELAHRGEHSIEFQALFLRHVFGSRRPARIVPVLCGSILDTVGPEQDPMACRPVARFVTALRDLLRAWGPRAAVIASVDLAHVGQQFGDEGEMTEARAHGVEKRDRALLAHAERMDAAAFFEDNRRDGDRRHICGFAALYTLLASVEAKRGRLLQYDQAIDMQAHSLVSFAAMVFERE